jgi:uncharacterized membrane protein YbaN (DUF454 family)
VRPVRAIRRLCETSIYMNQMKTLLLLAMMTALLLWVGQALAGRSGLLLAFAVAGTLNFASYWFSDKIVTRSALGYVLLVAGVVGVLIPIIPGTPFLIAAVAVLGSKHPVIRPWKERVDRLIEKYGKSKEKNRRNVPSAASI